MKLNGAAEVSRHNACSSNSLPGHWPVLTINYAVAAAAGALGIARLSACCRTPHMSDVNDTDAVTDSQ